VVRGLTEARKNATDELPPPLLRVREEKRRRRRRRRGNGTGLSGTGNGGWWFLPLLNWLENKRVKEIQGGGRVFFLHCFF